MTQYRVLKFYINMGMKVIKIQTIYRFKQSPWLAKYIDHNTQKRTKAKTNFEKPVQINEQCFLWENYGKCEIQSRILISFSNRPNNKKTIEVKL